MKKIITDFKKMDRGLIPVAGDCPGTDLGKWVWLMDSTHLVMAWLTTDPDLGIVGVPDWDWSHTVDYPSINLSSYERPDVLTMTLGDAK